MINHGGPNNESHKTTVALNGWADGEDVILRYGLYINPDTDSPYLEVASRNQSFFTYRPEDWPSGIALSTVFQLDATETLEISPNKPVVLMRATAESIDRGIVLWLESETHQKNRKVPDNQ